MSLIERMFGKNPEPKNILSLMQRITRRAEDLSPEEQAKSFVSRDVISESLLRRDSRIIYGRRGTGKTHVFSFVAESVQEKGDVAISLDLRIIGSNTSIYSDIDVPLGVRATHLIRDFAAAVAERLEDAYTADHPAFRGANLDDALQRLRTSVNELMVAEAIEQQESTSRGGTTSSGLTTALEASPTTASARASFERTSSSTEQSAGSLRVSGQARMSIRIGGIHGALSDISEAARYRIWILLDEWSSVPEALQPYLADVIRRAFLPIRNITVQIAAIEHRSKFRVDQGRDRIGFELGSDISSDIYLDDFFVYGLNPAPALAFFKDLVFKHLTALSEPGEFTCRTPQEVVTAAFTQENVFSEIVRACEGVPRDFINILQIAATRARGEKIAMPDARAAAKDWYDRDKARYIDTNPKAEQLLSWIVNEVIRERKSRAFMLETSRIDETIEYLFDERILHIGKRSYSTKDRPGVRYRLWKIDYGCYVDLMITANAPSIFLPLDVEFPDQFDFDVPADDFRAIRRTILDMGEFEKYLADQGKPA